MYMVSFWTELFLNFWIFILNYPCKKKKIYKNCLDEQEKFWTYLKKIPEKRRSFKAIWFVLAHLKPKMFSVSRPWCSTFFWGLPPTHRNYFSAATTLKNQTHFIINLYHTTSMLQIQDSQRTVWVEKRIPAT